MVTRSLALFASEKRAVLVLGLVVSTVAFMAMRALSPSFLRKVLQSKALIRALCGLFLAAYLVVLGFSTTYAGFLTSTEPQVASVAFRWLKGAPLYHDLTSAQRYSLGTYGPMVYLPYALALRVLGAHVLSLRLVVLLTNLCLFLLLWKCYRQLLEPHETWVLIVAVLVYLLNSTIYNFQIRGDLPLVVLAAFGLWAVLNRSVALGAVLLALACGLAFDIKVTAPLYFLPLYVLLMKRHGWRPAALAAVGAGACALVPFSLPGISPVAYLRWLLQTSHQPVLVPGELGRELKTFLFLIAPLALLCWTLGRRSLHSLMEYLRENRAFLLTFGLCFAALALAASKIGSGPHHFMPYYPLAGYVAGGLYVRSKKELSASRSAQPLSFVPLFWVWFAIALAVQVGSDSFPDVSRLFHSRWEALAVTSDLDVLMKEYPGIPMEMGYGESDLASRLSGYRPLLVFAGNPYTLDTAALDDMQLSGLEIPSSTLDYLHSCRTQIWLIPNGEQPFETQNSYSLVDSRLFPPRSLFSDDFRRTFLEQYRKRESTKYFDVWQCQTDSRTVGSKR